MKTWIISATIFYGLALFPSLGLIVVAPMLFDAPGSENSTALWVVFNCALMLPVLLLVSIAGMWIWHKKGLRNISMAFSLLPIADVVVLVGAYATLALTS